MLKLFTGVFLTGCFLLVLTSAYAQSTNPAHPFTTIWVVGSERSLTLSMNPEYSYAFHYHWEHVSDKTNKGNGFHTQGNLTLTFPKPGMYRLEITGTFPHFYDYPREQLVDVMQWGSIAWKSMKGSFSHWPGVDFSAADRPDLTGVTDMSNLFSQAIHFNGDIGYWDVSHIKRMNDLFNGAGLSPEKYDRILMSWAQQPLQHGVNLGGRGIVYCQAGKARNKLIKTYSWTINDDGSCLQLAGSK